MKKLNNKGFTLVELLAVIIILAIVVGISIPAITNVINDSKNNAMGVALNAAEKYITDQYATMAVDSNLTDGAFSAVVTEYKAQTITIAAATTDTKHKALIKAMGLNPADMGKMTIEIKADDSVCINVQTLPTKSQYYTTAYWTATTFKTGAKNKSKSC